jgi:autotransporter-associated beta strand protein
MAVTNRLPACIVHTYNQTYNNAASHAQYSNGGATTVKFRSASYATVDINGSTATTLFNAATNQIMSNNRSCYYLRTAADISAAGAYTLTVAGEPGNEAGMIINGNNTITPAVTFGADAAREGVVFVNYGRTGRLNGSVTTSGGLTKFGAGMLVLGTDNSATLTGQISVNQGMLRLENANALAGASPIRIESGAMLAMTGSYTLQNAITGFGTIGTDTNVCTLGASGSISPGASVGTLTAEKLDFRGTYNWEYDGTNSDLIACTTLAFGSGSATLNCAYLGGGAAPQGVYPLFTYQGSAPSLPSWTVTPPSGLSGEVSVDDANKRVILTLGPVASGTLIMIR